jgi:TRAP-type C4-dicarboxylate transport system permease small subunit
VIVFKLMMGGSAIAMVAALACVVVGVLGRELSWGLAGFDAYAGYAIAAALFLALPQTLIQSEHLRVTLLLEKLGNQAKRAVEILLCIFGVLVCAWIAWFSCRLVWVSWTLHDVSQGVDATPLWIPQSFMAIGALGFLLAMVQLFIRNVSESPIKPTQSTNDPQPISDTKLMKAGDQ